MTRVIRGRSAGMVERNCWIGKGKSISQSETRLRPIQIFFQRLAGGITGVSFTKSMLPCDAVLC